MGEKKWKKGQRNLVKGNTQIIDIFGKIKSHGNRLELVQSTMSEKIICESKIELINEFSQDIILRPFNIKEFEKFNFSAELPLLAKNDEETLFFKGNIRSKVWNNMLFVNFPNEIVVINSRESERVEYEDYNLPVLFNNKTEIVYNRKNLCYQGQLVNISEKGMALKVPMEFIEHFNMNDKIIVTSINGYSLSRSIIGNVSYYNVVKPDEGESYIKMALLFDRLFPLHSLAKYIKSFIVINEFK